MMCMLLRFFSLGLVAAVAACSIDGVTFAKGYERCTAEGDEDGNGLADCDDPACAGTAACRPGCGNSRVEAGEACDDGNRTNGDGCDNNCTASACGNGVQAPAEVCDDGNATDGDGCDSNCTPTACGNGVKTAGELCDDGNSVDGDGCESTCKGTGSGTYEATSDALIRTSAESDDADTNFGADEALLTYGSSFGTVARSVIGFDLSALPPGALIASAYLNVHLFDQAGAEFSVRVHEVTESWSETSVTWNNQPAIRATAEASLAFQGYTWWRFDVTVLVQRWALEAATYGSVALRQDPEVFTLGGQYAHFGSREGVHRPYLEIAVAP